ncbi:MAG TPA: hypothetical protein PLX97_05095 [Gemmatales bacterium]|nr:hypothetical protein [Gemmatales bacterium]
MKDLFTVMPYKEAPKDSAKPIRIWDAKAKKHCAGRYYKYHRNAHDGALLMSRWAKVGQTLEIIDARTGKLLGQYTRKLNSISYMAPDQVAPEETK